VNYLAHLYLAANDEGLLVGALLGDFLKGRLEALPLEPAVHDGVRLHRLIDSYTDGHPIVGQSKNRVSRERRRYAGLIIDLLYDHFLAVHWPRFAPQALEEFTRQSYRLLLAHHAQLPPRLQSILPRMAAEDWLGSYLELENIGYALERIGSRLRRGNPLLGVGEELKAVYPGAEADFLLFFPQLIDYVAAQRKLLGH
jgi:acyl carrier protein phosphodiesterase